MEKQTNDKKSTKKYVVGIIGCGRIANFAHLPALSKNSGIRIKYVCDIIVEKAIKAKKEFPTIEYVTNDYHEILNDKEVDAVFVLTPNYSHYTITMDALRANKNVLCEKPITVNYRLSLEMAEEAEKRGLILNIGVCNRFNKSIELLEEMNRKGDFGNIYHVYCSFRAFRAIPGLGGPFTTKSQSGGGVLIDWGIHFLDLILYILGKPKIMTVSSSAYSEMAKDLKSYHYKDMWAEDTSNIENGINDVDDFITGFVRTDKASISFNGAWAQNIDATEMFIDFLGDKCGARLTYGGKFVIYRGSDLKTIELEYDIPNMYECEDESFIQSCMTGIKDKGNIQYILDSARLLDALYESSDKKKELTIND